MSPPPLPASLDSAAADDKGNNAAAVLTIFQPPTTPAHRDQGGVILDALPYIDQVHEEYEQYATSLIQQEMKQESSAASSSTKRKLPPLAPLHFRTPFMQEQYERLEKRQGQATTVASVKSTIDLSPPSADEEENNVQAWQDALKRVKIGYERERIRAMLLELEKGNGDDDGSRSSSNVVVGIAASEWKMHNALHQQTEQYYQDVSQRQVETVEAINLQRQAEQQKQGQELSRLTAQYSEVQEKLQQLRQAVQVMEQEVQLQQQQE